MQSLTCLDTGFADNISHSEKISVEFYRNRFWREFGLFTYLSNVNNVTVMHVSPNGNPYMCGNFKRAVG